MFFLYPYLNDCKMVIGKLKSFMSIFVVKTNHEIIQIALKCLVLS